MRALENELTALAAHLGERRPAILQAWRNAVKKDPALTTGASLPRAQLNDHIPALLQVYEDWLRLPPPHERGAALAEQKNDAAAHGLHRWQQGYDLREVSRELGRLNECVVAELEAYAQDRPALVHAVMATARSLWAELCSIGISESTAQYFRLQQIEASGHIADLEQALEAIRELERRRAELWWQAAHDLRGNLGVVANATVALTRSAAADDSTPNNFLRLLERNVTALHHLLDDVTILARLHAGQEERRAVPTDVADLMHGLCDGLLPLAKQRGLFVELHGAAPFVVQADAVKVRRIAQNLVLNAVKYTRQGGVTVTWGDAGEGDANRWVLTVQDTGPGFHAGPGAPLAGALETATEQAAQLKTGSAGPAVHGVSDGEALKDRRPVQQAQGEGLGLSIVKRLCDLLDASVELESAENVGTTFRIFFPRHYEA